MSLETYHSNNTLYTKRENLKTWEFNDRFLTKERLEALKKDRSEIIDLSDILVIPEDDHFLILGGTMRYIADGYISKTAEPIKIIDFKEGEDGRWYQVEGGVVRTDKRSFASKKAAMKTIAYKANNNYGQLEADAVAGDMANPELAEVDWDGIFQNLGETNSLQEQADRIAPDSLLPDTLVDLPSGETDSARESKPDGGVSYSVKCPDCGAEFDPNDHPGKQVLFGKEPTVPAAMPGSPVMTTENSI